MKETKLILTRAVQIVTFVLAAFGGFLTEIAPPDGWETRFAVGLSSVTGLCVLLIVSGMSTRKRTARNADRWLFASTLLFILSTSLGIGYGYMWDRLTFAYPPETRESRFIAGTDLTLRAQQYREREVSKTTSEMVADFGGPQYRERIWEAPSLRLSRLLLIAAYIAFVLSISATIFCLTEGVAHRYRRQLKSGMASRREADAQG